MYILFTSSNTNKEKGIYGISSNNINIYGERLYKMPTPRYYVFYNGDKDMPDRKVLKLSDSFKREVSG